MVLAGYRWPGNIHELSIIMERAVMMSKGEEVEVDDAMLAGAGPLGSYRLIERIGRGGMGEVWRAKHQHLARPAAVKFIRGDGPEINATAIERFRREAEATARLRSPHTVELYDFGVSDDGAFYYVMELLEGFDLEGLVKESGPLPPERVVMLMLQLCRSLSEAHEFGLIHRDIKPANLFVSRLGGEYDFLKVLDFGMVTSGDAEGASDLTGSSVQGTPSYIAPEIVMNQPVDGRADLYCLGLVAYYLVTGQPVFEKVAPVQMFLNHVRTMPRRPSQVTDEPIPAALENLIMDCLQKDPADRPLNAEIVALRLEAIEFDEPWTHKRAKAWWWQLLNPDTVEMSDLFSDDSRTKKVKALDE